MNETEIKEKCTCSFKDKSEPEKHFRDCGVREGLKFPTLFYYSRDESKYIPFANVANTVWLDELGGQKDFEIKFKWIDTTDEEYNSYDNKFAFGYS